VDDPATSDDAPPPLDGPPRPAAGSEPRAQASKDFAELEQLEERLGVRERRKNLSSSADVVKKLRVADDGTLVEEEESTEEELDFVRGGGSLSRCSAVCLAVSMLVLVLVAGVGLWQVYQPFPLHCEVGTVAARRFKIDVSEFWTPKLQSTVQIGFDVRNRNPFRQMILGECKFELFEEATGLKLGAAQQTRLFLNPLSTMRMTLAVKNKGIYTCPVYDQQEPGLFQRNLASV